MTQSGYRTWRFNVILWKPFLILMMFAFLSTPARAADRCYSPEEVSAEKLLRLHSELMVITVACKQGSTGRDLGKAYTGFTNRYENELRKAERTLMDYYAKTHGGDGISHLDKLRTKLANDYGQQIANESAPAFCSDRRDAVTYLYDKPKAGLLTKAVSFYDTVSTYEPPCGGKPKKASQQVWMLLPTSSKTEPAKPKVKAKTVAKKTETVKNEKTAP
ncbi:MAG TPA: hypothetical protein DCY07_07720 [Rhodospirillaceae bacterium]|nr:hypothetical protein [Rhodospirillaceae bacterium]